MKFQGFLRKYALCRQKRIKSGGISWRMLQMSRQVFSRPLLQPSVLQLPVTHFHMNIQLRYLCHSICSTRPGQFHNSSFQIHEVQENKFASISYKSGRLPLTCTNEIEKIIEDNEDVISEYASFLGCSEAAIKEMVRHDTRFVTVYSKHDVLAKMKLLLDHGFHAEEIVRRYYFFTRSLDCIRSRLAEMKSVEHYRVCTHLLVASDRVFQKRMKEYQKEVAIMGEHGSQASFVASLLDCSEEKIVAKAKGRCAHLITMPPSRLKEIVEILQSLGVSKQKMCDECVMLRCLPSVARERIKCVIDAGVYNPNMVTYMLTTDPQNFHLSLKKWTCNLKALGEFQHEKELLMQRLQCSEEVFQDMIHRKSILLQLRAAKLKTSLDILMDEIGISAKRIIQFPELLYFSKIRLQSRWHVLGGHNLTEYQLVRALILPEDKFHRQFL